MSIRPVVRPRAGADDLSRWVARALAVGAVASIALVIAGTMFGMASITRAGLLLLVLSPMGHLAAAAAAFVRHGERRYAVAAAIVLALLGAGLAIAAATPTIGG